MELNLFAVPERLSLIYEEVDVDTIEERFVNLVAEIFSFDRVGPLFVKHRKRSAAGQALQRRRPLLRRPVRKGGQGPRGNRVCAA